MREVAHHVALALAVLGLGHAALLVASRLTPAGLERFVAMVVLAVAAAVAQALVLGLAGLGSSPVALCAATAVCWLAAVRLLPAPSTRMRDELAAWWGARRDGERAGLAALAGAGVAWLAWQLAFPSIGFDSSLYHYSLVAGWIQNGRPGSVLDLSYDIPYGSYPLTDEVALTWATGIARSWIPIALWNPALLVLLGIAGWSVLRRLGVAVRPAAVALSALLALPLVVRQLNEAQTDLPALAWLACVAVLVLGSARRPALLVPALLAAGLAIGTKTTAAPIAVAALAAGAYGARGDLRRLWRWLAVGLAGAVVVGGVWYLRNLVEHGSPLWPFAGGPFADPAPRFLGSIDGTFAQRPIATLEGRLGDYAERMGGGALALACALVTLAVAALAARRGRADRALLLTGGLTALGLLAWSMAWGTGLQTTNEVTDQGVWSLSATRYLLPVVGAAILTVALATRAAGLAGRLAEVALAGVLVWNLAVDVGLGAPYTPPAHTLVGGAAAGLAVLGVARLARGRVSLRAPRAMTPAAGAVLAAVVAGVLLAPVSVGYIERYTRVEQSSAFGRDVAAFLLRQPGFEDSGRPVAFASRGVLAPLAGDRFSHELRLVPARIRCDELRRWAGDAVLVVTEPVFFGGILGVEPYDGHRCFAGRRPAFEDLAFAVYLDQGRSARAVAPPR
jgi:hypothetical protein